MIPGCSTEPAVSILFWNPIIRGDRWDVASPPGNRETTCPRRAAEALPKVEGASYCSTTNPNSCVRNVRRSVRRPTSCRPRSTHSARAECVLRGQASVPMPTDRRTFLTQLFGFVVGIAGALHLGSASAARRGHSSANLLGGGDVIAVTAGRVPGEIETAVDGAAGGRAIIFTNLTEWDIETEVIPPDSGPSTTLLRSSWSLRVPIFGSPGNGAFARLAHRRHSRRLSDHRFRKLIAFCPLGTHRAEVHPAGSLLAKRVRTPYRCAM